MGLYLCLWGDSDELDGVDVGSYADYGRFVEAVVRHAEQGNRGSRCPLISIHSDSDGEWSPSDCAQLAKNLEELQRTFSSLPPAPIPEGWQSQVAKTFGIKPESLEDCFFDVDGEPLITRLIGLCRLAIHHQKSILFQ
jgi:hypothetical protein